MLRADARYYGGPILTAALPISVLVIGAAAFLLGGNRAMAADFALVSIASAMLAFLRSRRPRGVLITADGIENRTGIWRQERARWADVIRVDRERSGVFVIRVSATGKQDRQIVVHGSDELASVIGWRDAASVEGPVRVALAQYRAAHAPATSEASHAKSAWVAGQLSLLMVGLGLELIAGAGLFRAIALLNSPWREFVREGAFSGFVLGAAVPLVMVPGWIGPRLPRNLRDLADWRSATDLLPFMVPWMVLLGGRAAS